MQKIRILLQGKPYQSRYGRLGGDNTNTKQFEKCRKKALKVILLYLDSMLSPEKAATAPLNQLSSAVGVLTEKFLKSDGDEKDNGKIDDILSALKEEC